MTEPEPASLRRRLFSAPSDAERLRLADILRKETVGGVLLLAATVIALVWANSPAAAAYFDLRDLRFGIPQLHLDLTVGAWASDGLLAIFFFIAGLELKREFVAGDLRDVRRAVVPVSAAVGGVALPAIIYVVVNLAGGGETLRGWAIPTATDIAFALAVLAIVSTHLPSGLRTFLLTLAVVDDLLAIGIIAFFYTDHLQPLWLLAALVPLSLFAVLVQKRIRHWYLLVPLALATWGLVHASGVHATVAGVLLAFTVPVLRSAKNGGPDAGPGLAEHFEHRIRPLSTGVAVPIFALFSAGVALGGVQGLAASLTDVTALGIVAALLLGKTLGVFGTTFLLTKLTRAELDAGLAWRDVFSLAVLTGMGFTVSLLIAELSFGASSEHTDHAKVAILVASAAAAIIAGILLKLRDRHYRRAAED